MRFVDLVGLLLLLAWLTVAEVTWVLGGSIWHPVFVLVLIVLLVYRLEHRPAE